MKSGILGTIITMVIVMVMTVSITGRIMNHAESMADSISSQVSAVATMNSVEGNSVEGHHYESEKSGACGSAAFGAINDYAHASGVHKIPKVCK